MANRSRGEGNVHRLPSGTWRAQVMVGYQTDGKKQRISFSAPTKKEVLALIREYQAQVDANIHISRSITLLEWSDTWYANYQDQVEASTYANYRYTLRIIQDRLGKKILADILPLDIERFLRGLKAKYSESQISKCRSMLIQIYDAADANGLVSRNPARKSKPPKKKRSASTSSSATKQKKDSFTEEEVSSIIANHSDDLIGNSVCLMIGTGIREQELLALSKADIASDGSSIDVNKAVQTVNGKSVLGPPKSENSNRTVPVPNDYKQFALYLLAHGSEPYIWTSSKKNPLFSVRAFQRKYYKMLENIDAVRRLSPHCCRHTYITRLQARKVPMETIARLAGHSRIETTDKYLHTAMDVLEAAVSTLNQEK